MSWWELMQMLSLREADEHDLDPEPEGDPDVGDPEGGMEPGEDHEGEGGGGVPEDALPDFLRGRNPDEVRAAITQAFQGSQVANQTVQQLRRELDEVKSSMEKPQKPPEPEEPEKPLDELLYEDPEAAIDQVIRKRYGHKLADIENRVGSTVISTVKSELPDFDEYEEEVTDLLKQSGAPATRENIIGAYQMALGRKAMQERSQQSRRKNNPERPKKEKPAPKKPQLTDLERDIARGMGMSDEDYATARDNDDFEVKVPT